MRCDGLTTSYTQYLVTSIGSSFPTQILDAAKLLIILYMDDGRKIGEKFEPLKLLHSRDS